MKRADKLVVCDYDRVVVDDRLVSAEGRELPTAVHDLKRGLDFCNQDCYRFYNQNQENV